MAREFPTIQRLKSDIDPVSCERNTKTRYQSTGIVWTVENLTIFTSRVTYRHRVNGVLNRGETKLAVNYMAQNVYQLSSETYLSVRISSIKDNSAILT